MRCGSFVNVLLNSIFSFEKFTVREGEARVEQYINMPCQSYRVLVFKFGKRFHCVKLKTHQIPRTCTFCSTPHVQIAQRNYSTSMKNVDDHLIEKSDMKEAADPLHVPVLKDEVLSYFTQVTGKKFLDMTFGAGGHTCSILDNITDCHVYALDRDPLAHKIACNLAEQRPGRVTPLLGRFSELPTLLAANGVQPGDLDGILMDLGASSMQFDQAQRGFSISMEGPLDMRMDADRCPDQPTAADVVNNLNEADLALIFKKYGEDRRSKKLACAIVEARSAFGKIHSTKDLAGIIESVCQGAYGVDSLGRYAHPATRIFLALRTFVNNELNELNSGLEIAYQYLRHHGICVAISFQPLEDRIVKRHFHSVHMDEKNSLSIIERQRLMDKSRVYSKEEIAEIVVHRWERMYKRVVLPTTEEIEVNPRSRSAKLRAAIRV